MLERVGKVLEKNWAEKETREPAWGRPGGGRVTACRAGQRKSGRVKRGLSPTLSDHRAILSSVTSSAITLQCLKNLKEKLQFKRKTLHALFAYEWWLYN